MAQRRDSKGRFAGSGSTAARGRATTTGARARRSTQTLKQEQSGAKDFGAQRSRQSRISSRYASQNPGTSDAAYLTTAARGYTRQAAATRKKGKAMERERRSLLRRGSMRGGGSERMSRSI
jgi:hypothetical protein